MQYNIIVVFDMDKSHMLMCKRSRDPYKDMLNFVGGKIEKNENHTQAAYRELQEETSISKDNIHLTHIMDFSYILDDGLLEVYVGTLSSEVKIDGIENQLLWVDVNEDFSDISRFAGCGNIYHILNYINANRSLIDVIEKAM